MHASLKARQIVGMFLLVRHSDARKIQTADYMD